MFDKGSRREGTKKSVLPCLISSLEAGRNGKMDSSVFDKGSRDGKVRKRTPSVFEQRSHNSKREPNDILGGRIAINC